MTAAGSKRGIRKTERPVVWEGAGAQSPSADPIFKGLAAAMDPPAVSLRSAAHMMHSEFGAAIGSFVAGLLSNH